MSAPRIKIISDETGHDDVPPFVWFCQQRGCDGPSAEGETYTIADAADAGRAHLATFHTAQMPTSTYCRTHGTHTGECGCGIGKSPAGDVGGRENGLGAIPSDAQLYGICEAHDMPPTSCFHLHAEIVPPAQPFGDDFPCCTTPMQHADHSREDC